MIAFLVSWIVGAIVISAWAFLAHTVWSHQEIERENLFDDIVWQPTLEAQGRR